MITLHDVFFVQVGAHEGNWGWDYIFPNVMRHGWRGLLIEPVRYLFDRLRENYARCEGLIFENMAISEHEGPRTIYRAEETKLHLLPPWASGLGTFYRPHLKDHGIPDEYIVAEQVRCTTLERLIDQHKISRVDVIAIDTEGHDYTVLKTIPFDRISPTAIIYEHVHLNPEENLGAERLLATHGFTQSTELNGNDRLAWRDVTSPELLESLADTFQRRSFAVEN